MSAESNSVTLPALPVGALQPRLLVDLGEASVLQFLDY